MKLRDEKACDSVSLTYCGHNLFTRQWVVYKNCIMFVVLTEKNVLIVLLISSFILASFWYMESASLVN